jgi:hypothetical protein
MLEAVKTCSFRGRLFEQNSVPEMAKPELSWVVLLLKQVSLHL